MLRSDHSLSAVLAEGTLSCSSFPGVPVPGAPPAVFVPELIFLLWGNGWVEIPAFNNTLLG